MSQAENNQALEQFGGQEFARRAAGLYPPSLESQIHMMTDLLFCISTIQHRTCLDVPIRLASRAAAA